MMISGVNNQYGGYINGSYSKKQKASNNFMGHMSVTSKKVEKQEDGEVLGLTMINEPGTDRFWAMKAKYAECSTQENPVIYVETNYGGKTVTYNVNINEVDPNSASQLEMFALCSYADDVGIGDNSTFGTYKTLCSYQEMAHHNGYLDTQIEELSTFQQYKNVKLNWGNMSKKVIDLLYKCNDLIQYKKGLNIMDLFSKYPVK
ncbi:MAG: hypothetical protein GX271_03260 [Clostridiales bacterium]|nr:hypothetical protein [Clostridiales bacterium]